MLRKGFGILPTSIGVFSVVVAMLIAVFAVDSQAASTETSNCSVVLLGASYARGWPIARIGDFSVINKGVITTNRTAAVSPDPGR